MMTLGQAKAVLARMALDGDTEQAFEYLGVFRKGDQRGHGFLDPSEDSIIVISGQPGESASLTVLPTTGDTAWEHVTVLNRLGEIPRQLHPPTLTELMEWLRDMFHGYNLKTIHYQRLIGTASRNHSDQVRIVYQYESYEGRIEYKIVAASYKYAKTCRQIFVHKSQDCSPLELLSYQARDT